jgi:hypothetical protein
MPYKGLKASIRGNFCIWRPALWPNVYMTLMLARAALEARSTTSISGNDSEFTVLPRKTAETTDPVSRSKEIPDADWLLASSQAFRFANVNRSRYDWPELYINIQSAPRSKRTASLL